MTVPRVVAFAGAFAAALGVRALPWREVFEPGGVVFFGNDAWYHARRIAYGVVHFPERLGHDPYLAFPEGARAIWAPGFDAVLAALAHFFLGAQDEGGSLLALERFLVWVPPMLGAATVVVAMGVAHRLFGAAESVWTGLVLCVLPAHFWYSRIGFVDHHAAVALLSTAGVALALGAGIAFLEPVASFPRRVVGRLRDLSGRHGLDVARRARARGAHRGGPRARARCGCEACRSEARGRALRGHERDRRALPAARGARRGVAVGRVEPARPVAIPALRFRRRDGRGGGLRRALAWRSLRCDRRAPRGHRGRRFCWRRDPRARRDSPARRRHRRSLAMALARGAVPASRRRVAAASRAGRSDLARRGVAPLRSLRVLLPARPRRRRAVGATPSRALDPVRLWGGAPRRDALPEALLCDGIDRLRDRAGRDAVSCLARVGGRRPHRALGGRGRSHGRLGSAPASLCGLRRQPMASVYGRTAARWDGLRHHPCERGGRRLAPLCHARDVRVAGARGRARVRRAGPLAPRPRPHLSRKTPERGRQLRRRPRRRELRLGPPHLRRSRERSGSRAAPASRPLRRHGGGCALARARRGPGDSLLRALHETDGASPALPGFRLVTETRAATVGRPGAPARFKVFERVAGARVSGVAAPGVEVEARIEVRTARGRTFAFIAHTVAGPDGSYQLRLPYATRGAPSGVRIAGAYVLRCGARRASLAVDEEAVQRGLEIEGPALCGGALTPSRAHADGEWEPEENHDSRP